MKDVFVRVGNFAKEHKAEIIKFGAVVIGSIVGIIVVSVAQGMTEEKLDEYAAALDAEQSGELPIE